MLTEEIIDLPKFKHSNNWKGGRYKSRGYWYIWKPNYLRSHKNNYVREHIYIYQEYYRCCLLKWGNIHHKNGIKDDNRIENLEGLTRSQHIRLHMIGKQIRKIKDIRFCLNCYSNKTYTDRKGIPYWHKVKNGYVCSKRPCRRIFKK